MRSLLGYFGLKKKSNTKISHLSQEKSSENSLPPREKRRKPDNQVLEDKLVTPKDSIDLRRPSSNIFDSVSSISSSCDDALPDDSALFNKPAPNRFTQSESFRPTSRGRESQTPTYCINADLPEKTFRNKITHQNTWHFDKDSSIPPPTQHNYIPSANTDREKADKHRKLSRESDKWKPLPLRSIDILDENTDMLGRSPNTLSNVLQSVQVQQALDASDYARLTAADLATHNANLSSRSNSLQEVSGDLPFTTIHHRDGPLQHLNNIPKVEGRPLTPSRTELHLSVLASTHASAYHRAVSGRLSPTRREISGRSAPLAKQVTASDMAGLYDSPGLYPRTTAGFDPLSSSNSLQLSTASTVSTSGRQRDVKHPASHRYRSGRVREERKYGLKPERSEPKLKSSTDVSKLASNPGIPQPLSPTLSGNRPACTSRFRLRSKSNMRPDSKLKQNPQEQHQEQHQEQAKQQEPYFAQNFQSQERNPENKVFVKRVSRLKPSTLEKSSSGSSSNTAKSSRRNGSGRSGILGRLDDNDEWAGNLQAVLIHLNKAMDQIMQLTGGSRPMSVASSRWSASDT